jgi:hypothetical protein
MTVSRLWGATKSKRETAECTNTLNQGWWEFGRPVNRAFRSSENFLAWSRTARSARAASQSSCTLWRPMSSCPGLPGRAKRAWRLSIYCLNGATLKTRGAGCRRSGPGGGAPPLDFSSAVLGSGCSNGVDRSGRSPHLGPPTPLARCRRLLKPSAKITAFCLCTIGLAAPKARGTRAGESAPRSPFRLRLKPAI